MRKKPILLQVAMEVECNTLLKEIENINQKEISGYTFYEGTINGYPIVISLSKVGLIEASSSLTIAIETYHPKLIINYGIAGSTTPSLHVKDIVIATNCININSYKTAYFKKDEGSHPEKWELLTFLSGKPDCFTKYESTKILLDIAKKNPPQGNYLCGTIGSGDVWNQEVDRILFLNEKYHILCEDMESAATYKISKNRNLPVISFKIISDNLLLGEEYNREIGGYLQEYIIQYVKVLIRNIL